MKCCNVLQYLAFLSLLMHIPLLNFILVQFSIYLPYLHSYTHFISLSTLTCPVFDQLRQPNEISSKSFIIHKFSSSPSSCPSADRARTKLLCRQASQKQNVCVLFLNKVSTDHHSCPLCSFSSSSSLLPQSAESIAPLHLQVFSIRNNNGPKLDGDCLLLWHRMSISWLGQNQHNGAAMGKWYACDKTKHEDRGERKGDDRSR